MLFIEGLRGLVALYVVLSHICSMADPRLFAGKVSQSPEWLQMLMRPFTFGHIAVAAFIVVSGFCLQMSIFASGTDRITNLVGFYWRRAKRILPAYYACLAASIIVALTITTSLKESGVEGYSQYLPVDAPTVLSHIFLVHNLSAEWMYKLNGVLWSIGTEVQLYLLFPLLLLGLRKAGRLNTVVIAGVLSIVLLVAWPESLKFRPWYLALFALGMSSAHIAYRPPSAKPLGREAVMLAVLGAIGTLYFLTSVKLMPVSDFGIGITFAALMHACASAPQARFTKFLSTNPVVALGTISYSLYLMHHPVQQILFYFRPSFVQGEAAVAGYLMLIGLPVILLTCFGFWLAFERPMQKRLLASSRVRVLIPTTSSLQTISTEVAIPQEALVIPEPSESPAWARDKIQIAKEDLEPVEIG